MKVIIVALTALGLLGCNPSVQDAVDKAKSVLENVEIKPTPEQRPEEDRG